MIGLRDAGKALDAAEMAANAVALAACWMAAVWLLHHAEAAWTVAALFPLPHGTADIMAMAASSDMAERALGLVTAVGCGAACAVLAFSAAEGTWWLLRRVLR